MAIDYSTDFGPGGAALGIGIKMVCLEVDFDSSYPTGGEVIDLSVATMGELLGFSHEVYGAVVLSDTLGWVVQYDLATDGAPATGKLKVYHADYDSSSDGELIEMTSTGDLSTLVNVRMIFYGR